MTISLTAIETVSGVLVDLADPRPEDIRLTDIAWSLSRQGRFTGHTLGPLPYSVAQHTVMVSRYVEEALTPGTHLHEVFNRLWLPGDASRTIKNALPDFKHQMVLHGLLHDFGEAYLVDIPTPVKRLAGVHEALKVAEVRLDEVIFSALGLKLYQRTGWPEQLQASKVIVRWADMHALAVEAYHFMPSRGLNWGFDQERPSLQSIQAFRQPVPAQQAYEELLQRYAELTEGLVHGVPISHLSAVGANAAKDASAELERKLTLFDPVKHGGEVMSEYVRQPRISAEETAALVAKTRAAKAAPFLDQYRTAKPNVPLPEPVMQRQWIEGSDESNAGWHDVDEVDFATPLHSDYEALFITEQMRSYGDACAAAALAAAELVPKYRRCKQRRTR